MGDGVLAQDLGRGVLGSLRVEHHVVVEAIQVPCSRTTGFETNCDTHVVAIIITVLAAIITFTETH